jgi:hypothetical protein
MNFKFGENNRIIERLNDNTVHYVTGYKTFSEMSIREYFEIMNDNEKRLSELTSRVGGSYLHTPIEDTDGLKIVTEYRNEF